MTATFRVPSFRSEDTAAVTEAVILLCPTKILLETPEEDWLAALGTAPYIFTDAQSRDLVLRHFPRIGHRIRFYPSFNDNATVELDVYELARELHTDQVIALAEIDLLRAARIRDHLNRGETCYEARTIFYRDKFLMKQRLAEYGIPVRPMAPFASALELKSFIDRVGYPVIVKPRDGRGSLGITTLRSDADLRTYVSKAESSTFYAMMVEQYVDAPMIHVNGLYRDALPAFITPVMANVGCLEFIEGSSLAVAMLDLDSDLYRNVIALTRKIIEQAMPSIPEMLFYLELFVDTDGTLVVCEIACRLGGNGACQEAIEAFGFNPRLEYIKAVRGLDGIHGHDGLHRPKQHVGYIAIPPRPVDLFPCRTHPALSAFYITSKQASPAKHTRP